MGQFSEDQRKVLIANKDTLLFINLDTAHEIQVAERENVNSIQNIVSGDGYFYVMTNLRDGQLGMYLLALDYNNPDEPCFYYMANQNNLEISNVNMYHLPSQNQMCVCYSTIGVNSFNVLIFSLKSRRILFNFEMF